MLDNQTSVGLSKKVKIYFKKLSDVSTSTLSIKLYRVHSPFAPAGPGEPFPPPGGPGGPCNPGTPP